MVTVKIMKSHCVLNKLELANACVQINAHTHTHACIYMYRGQKNKNNKNI